MEIGMDEKMNRMYYNTQAMYGTAQAQHHTCSHSHIILCAAKKLAKSGHGTNFNHESLMSPIRRWRLTFETHTMPSF